MKKNKNLSEEKIKKIKEDPNWVNAKRYDFDLRNMIEGFPEGCPNRIIATALGLSEEEVESIYLSAIYKLKKSMGADNE